MQVASNFDVQQKVDIESGCVQEFLEDTGTNRKISMASAAAFGFATSTGRHGAGVDSKYP